MSLLNQKFGYLTALAETKIKNRKAWCCECVCGNVKKYYEYALKNGNSTSCGCQRGKPRADTVGTKRHNLTVIKQLPDFRCVVKCDCGNVKTIETKQFRYLKSCGCMIRGHSHLMSSSKIYSSWANMKERCDNTNHVSYENYGGRGISYEPKWRSFESFYDDMKDTYIEGYSLERIDCNGNYEKSNCTWIPVNEQPKNTRRTYKIHSNGKTLTPSEWAVELGVSRSSIYYYFRKYGNLEKLLANS